MPSTRPTFVEELFPSKRFFMRLVSPAKLLQLPTCSALVLGILLGTSCSKATTDKEDTLMRNDFDHLSGWLDNTPSLTQDKAHSGAYSVVVKPGTERSLGYDITLGQLSSTRPYKIRISAWAMRTSDQQAAELVVEIKDPGEGGAHVLRDSIDLGKKVQKLNTWQRVERVIAVPPMVSASSHIMVYMQGAKTGQPTYLDDLALSLVAK